MRSKRVVICGGGVAALEALLTLRQLLEIRPHVDLVAPNRKFVYRPMAVAEPFGLARTHLFDLEAIAGDLGAELHVARVLSVDGAAQRVALADGSSLSYDAAIIALGAQRRPWLAGSVLFGDAQDAPELTELLGRVERGSVSRVAFAAPVGTVWTLPLYELALLTSSRLGELAVGEVELTVVTHEAEPLAVFGSAAGRMLRGLLADRGIHLRLGATVEALHAGQLELDGGQALEVEEVVVLPRLEGPRLPGLPADGDGFILVDEHCRVEGMEGLYAAGDAASFAIKQGGLAAQQGDVAAEGVAADFGAPVQPQTVEPLLRGMLLTGVAPMYLRSDPRAPSDGEVAPSALWWPPTKIAGRYIGGYLASISVPGERASLEDRVPSARDIGVVESGHREARELALFFADADARDGDVRSALHWLLVVERLDGVLPPRYVERRESWQRRLAAEAAGSAV